MKKRSLPSPLTQSQKERLYSHTSDPRDRAIWSLGLNGGLRASEITNLKLLDVDWEAAQIKFIGKGQKERLVPMNLRLRIDLALAVEHRPSQVQHDLVIWSKRDPAKGITRFGVYRLLRRYGQKAGLERRLHPHLLRHTAATDFYRSCKDIRRTQAFLGHARIDTSCRYTHLDEQDVRETLESINRPNFIVRLMAQFHALPASWSLWRPAQHRVPYAGGTIGRHKELAMLKLNLENRVSTVVVAERGGGKSHLLRQLDGEHVYRLDSFRPPRERLAELCSQLKTKGLIPELPKGRGTGEFVKALRQVGRQHRPVVIIDSLNDITATGVAELRKLIESWTIIAGLDTRYAHRATEIFFGSHDVLQLLPLNKTEARQLADEASQDLDLPNKATFINTVLSEAASNPQAILEMVDRARRTRTGLVEHPGIQKTLSATPFLSLFLLWAVLSRYVAASLGHPDLKILVTLGIIALSLVIVFDRVLVRGNKL